MFAAALFAVSSANAAISLVIDADTNQFWFTGSDTGTMIGGGMPPSYGVGWVDDGGQHSGSTAPAGGLKTAFTIGASSADYVSLGLYSDGATGISFGLSSYSNPGFPVTIMADESVVFDMETVFSGWNATYETIFESFIGSSLTMNEGSGFSSVSVMAPVPEPSSYAALAGLGALGLIALRRRRKA